MGDNIYIYESYIIPPPTIMDLLINNNNGRGGYLIYILYPL